MAMAKATNLSVRPVQSADLCYPVDGIIEYQPEDLLGRAVRAYDLRELHDKLEPRAAVPSAFEQLNPIHGGLKTVDKTLDIASPVPSPTGDGPLQIERELANATLSRLRAEDIATGLAQAICWHGLKYSADQTDEAVEKRIELLGRNTKDPNSLPALLDKLSEVLRSRYAKLAKLYQDNPENWPDDVINPFNRSIQTGRTSGGQMFETTSTTDTTYYGREYHFPSADNRARYLRSEIMLRQERLAAFRLTTLNTGRNVLLERAMTAADVRKIQLAYIDTFLVAPFDGLVTGVFRNVGDFVAAGQPVLRLENDKTIYLVGTIKCRSLVRIGHTAHVTTTLFGEPGASPVEIEGKVCAVRGHEAIDEQWDVLIRCDNQAPSGRILPLNYTFDFDSTAIEIEPS
jgi:hypothetical protein